MKELFAIVIYVSLHPVLYQFPAMLPKSKLWEYFIRNKTLYKTDRTHQNTWCKSCVESHVWLCRNADKLAAAEGQLECVRGDSELESTGQQMLN